MRTSIDLQGYLINWRADLEKAAERKRVQGMEAHQEAESIEADIDDLDRAIAALTPASAPVEIEIPEGFTRWDGGECPVDPDARVSVMFLDGEISHDGVIAGNMNWAHDVSCAARIYAYRVTEQASVQDETLDQGAPEPVVRASPGEVEESRDQSADEQDDASEFAEPAPDAEFVALDEQTCKPLDADFAQILHDNMDELLITDEAPALNEAMQDEREEPVALAQPEWNEPEAHIQAVEAERYALATNPEADFWSRGLASDQKPQSRFNIFGIKPKVDA